VETARELERYDRSPVLPRLGGMARPDGVVIVSERYWAFAGSDGSLREGEMPHVPGVLHRLPLARGLARLAASLSPLFRRSGVTPRRERYLILLAVLAPLGLAVVGGPWSNLAGALLSAALLVTILRGRALPVTYLADRVVPLAPAFWSPLVVLVLSLALTMELWRVVQSSAGRFWRVFLLPGLALQRVTTREPRLDETQVALRAVAAVLARELDG
jgi:hypothetical protein